jgi:hypothetical protein
MRPGERQTILANRQQREKAERQANEARIREIEAEQAAEKKKIEEERARQERMRNPVSWGWGYGPRYWPHPHWNRRQP